MNNTKVVLNHLTQFYNGGHERIFYAMLQGAAVLAGRNPWLEGAFTEGQDILFYDPITPSLDEQLSALFQDQTALSSVAMQGYQEAQDKHTWVSRAQNILELANVAVLQ